MQNLELKKLDESVWGRHERGCSVLISVQMPRHTRLGSKSLHKIEFQYLLTLKVKNKTTLNTEGIVAHPQWQSPSQTVDASSKGLHEQKMPSSSMRLLVR